MVALANNPTNIFPSATTLATPIAYATQSQTGANRANEIAVGDGLKELALDMQKPTQLGPQSFPGVTPPPLAGRTYDELLAFRSRLESLQDQAAGTAYAAAVGRLSSEIGAIVIARENGGTDIANIPKEQITNENNRLGALSDRVSALAQKMVQPPAMQTASQTAEQIATELGKVEQEMTDRLAVRVPGPSNQTVPKPLSQEEMKVFSEKMYKIELQASAQPGLSSGLQRLVARVTDNTSVMAISMKGGGSHQRRRGRRRAALCREVVDTTA